MTEEVTMTAGEPGEPASGCAVSEGLSWSWALDIETLLAALSEPAPWNRPIPGPARPTPPAQGDETTEPVPANTEPTPTPPPPRPRPPSPRPPTPRTPSPRTPSPRTPSPRTPSPRTPSPRTPSH